jgi:hypothetical protein
MIASLRHGTWTMTQFAFRLFDLAVVTLIFTALT